MMMNTNVPKIETPKRGGRKTKFNQSLIRRVLRCLERGMPLGLTASAAGVQPGTLGVYRRQHPDFEQNVQQAIAKGIQARLDVVIKAMKSSDENVRLRAATWWLSHAPAAAQHFSESRKIELSGEVDGRVAVLVWPHRAPADLKTETQISVNGTNNHIARTSQDAD
jgi:hypothetical protein